MITLLIACLLILIVFVIIPLYVYYLNAKISKQKIIFEQPNLPKETDVEYHRNIPFNKDIIKAYGIAINFKIINNKSNLIGALLLRWIKLGYISIIQDTLVYGFALKIPTDLSFDNEIEQDLLNILRKASKENQILEYQEFKTYCSSNSIEIIGWFKTVDYYAEKLLKIDGCIKEENVVISKMFNLINRLDSHKIITKKSYTESYRIIRI